MFVHLHCHSHYSLLRAIPRPEEIVAAAAEQARRDAATLPETLRGGAVALTDTNGLYAAVPFYQAAREAGVKPIVGTVLDTAWQAASDPSPLLLLAANTEGYSNLCRLVTRRQLEERPVSLEALAEHRQGLIALLPAKGEAGATHRAPTARKGSGDPRATDHPSRVPSLLGALRDIFGDALYLELHHLAPGDGRQIREALRLSREFAVPVVATNSVHFLRPEEHLHYRVLNAIRAGALLSTIAPPEITTAEAHFKSAAEMRRAFPDLDEALRATLEIAERAHLELELGKLVFPEFPVPEGETAFSFLWKLCFEGARRRYRPVRPEVLSRLTHELEVIHKLNLAPYFLLVREIAEEARRRGIPAVARGSAASSLVAYCLGISRVCPLRWGLYFERFLNEQRGDCPDIDLDICGARRDEMLDHVYARWGTEHVAMISTFVTMHARLAVREVAKVFGLSPGEVNHFTQRLPHRPVREILEAIRTLPECRALPADEEPWKTVLEVALRLDGFPRHLGIHPCGTVISSSARGKLSERVPLEVATKGIVVTQYDMNAIEALGLIKIDLLGQRGLTTISLALGNIEASTGQRLELDALPENDLATCAMLAQGRTMGVFQIESPGMRGLLRALGARASKPGRWAHKPASHPEPVTSEPSAPRHAAEEHAEAARKFTLEEISLALALIRPGASEYGSKETFLKRLRGLEPVRYPHPRLAPILRETLGVCVYQEQVMQIAQAAGALSLAEADLVRRASAKFADQRERDRLRAKFLKAATQLGLAGAAREEAWRMVEKFAGFGFCKAHAATYADLSYRIAYLKAHYPAEFFAAMCSSGAGFYHVSAYVEEAKRWGIEVRLPSVNHSRLAYTTEPCAGAKRAMRVGLMQVKGLRAETIAHIVRSREEQGPYRSLEDFLARVPVERDEIESLIKCGALDSLPDAAWGRPALLWQLNLLARKHAAPPPAEWLFPDAAAPATQAVPLGTDYSREQRLAYEQEILEVCVSGHPLDLVTRNGEAWSDQLASAKPGQRVCLLGWLITFRHVATKDYRNMMFATLEDQRGVYEIVLFPEAYQRYGGLIYETRALRVTGRLEPDGQINCEQMEALRL